MKRTVSFVLVLIIAFALTGCGNKVIGTIKGAEWDSIVIDNIEYVRTFDSGLSASDKGKCIGKVTDGGKTTFKAYSVKSDETGNYIYCMWDWEGLIYEKK